MNYRFLPILLSALSLTPAIAQTNPTAPATAVNGAVQDTLVSIPQAVSLDIWKNEKSPFSFTYDGKDSFSFLASWLKSESPVTPSEGGETHHYVYTDPTTKLKIAADVRTFTDFDAVEWVLNITNGGSTDSPILENIRPLNLAMASLTPDAVLHTTIGSSSNVNDFMPKDINLPSGAEATIGANDGRSSDGAFPFFNLQMGDHGIIGAIGWSGTWNSIFNREKTTKDTIIHLTAGMQKTHLLLHPGETIRTPRILLLNWKGGDVVESQNLWRRLILAHYSPKDLKGQTITLPFVDDSWGTEKIETKMKRETAMHDKQIPIDNYWIDAGWYGNEKINNPANNYEISGSWEHERGNWSFAPELFPNGFKPLGDLLKSYNIDFLVWIEAEAAMAGTDFPTKHPDWYIKLPGNDLYLLNLGNPDALKGMTDFVSKWIGDSGITWYRQDFNMAPAGYWASLDTPDRIGMTEIKDIEGLYAYWDALRAQHPGLQIDNCASGGRRLDLETITRSAALWRSDNAGDPIGEQCHTQGLAPWVPLNSGVWWDLVSSKTPQGGPLQAYARRSAYSAGLTFCCDYFPDDWMKPAVEEFHEARPYAYGDFYSLLSYSTEANVWVAYQWHRPDLKSGMLVFLRRPGSAFDSTEVDLHAIDPNASYDVEIRNGETKSPTQQMSGKDFAHFKIAITDKPGSALVFYKQH
jgi:alpha-galactosidase